MISRQLHFLHLGKNAGTHIKRLIDVINRRNPGLNIVKHPHKIKLAHLPELDDYFFSIRSPETRFVSGFYSRKRKGQPRIYVEWTRYERQSFETFEHANDLAEALFAEGPLGFAAFCAVNSIRHCAMNQVNWFQASGYFFQQRLPVAILRQENLQEDLRFFIAKLGLLSPPEIPVDRVASHLNDYTNVPPLSELAKRNLAKWYSQDFEFYRCCNEWIQEHHRL
jgi:hypothetical protein